MSIIIFKMIFEYCLDDDLCGVCVAASRQYRRKVSDEPNQTRIFGARQGNSEWLNRKQQEEDISWCEWSNLGSRAEQGREERLSD